jgi:serine/threonine-protein kinase
MFAVFPQRFGRYTLERVVSDSGGQGEIYLATDRNLDRQVALKVLKDSLSANEEFVGRFFGEAEILLSLDHRNIVKVWNTGEIDGRYFIDMELIDGLDLRRWTRNHGALPIEIAVHLLFHIASGLQHAHEKGVIHRDIKPENVMLTARGEVKVLDFGLGRIMDEEMHRTVDGTVMGTWAYMSPEQLDGYPATTAFDVYSLGAVAYELLSARPPFTGNAASIYRKVKSEKPEPVNKLCHDAPANLANLVHQMLAKKPEQRPREMREVVESLRPVLRALGVSGVDDLLARYVHDPAGVAAELAGRRSRR